MAKVWGGAARIMGEIADEGRERTDRHAALHVQPHRSVGKAQASLPLTRLSRQEPGRQKPCKGQEGEVDLGGQR